MASFYPSARAIADSVSPSGDRLITMEVEFHRFILAEFNTHRQFSRNFQSSRAIPVEKLLELVLKSPAMPLHYGKNQPGMQAEQEHDGLVSWPFHTSDYLLVEDAWGLAASTAATIAKAFHEAGYHKQIVNRLIEPFLPVRGVVTASEEAYNHFFSLRCHKAAQPEIQALANEMRAALGASVPVKLNVGDWHLPYLAISNEVVGSPSLEELIKISISCCAQVSYRKLDDSLEKALDIYTKLNLPSSGEMREDPPHFSPAEHVAICISQSPPHLRGNFNTPTFAQYRKLLECGVEGTFLEYTKNKK